MIKKKKTKTKFYYIQCGDWEGFVSGESPKDSCKNAIAQSIEKFGDNMKVTKVMVCMDCRKSVDFAENTVEAFLVESLMEEMHEN